MATTKMIEVQDQNPVKALQNFLRKVLTSGEIGGVLVPLHSTAGGLPMPTLVADPERLDGADLLCPSFPLNAARLASRLSRGRPGEKILAVLRPCEIRAFVELIKLNQGSLDDILLLSLDCFGAYNNKDYLNWVDGDKPFSETSAHFLRSAQKGELQTKDSCGTSLDLAPACRACEFPAPQGADLIIGLAGADIDKSIPVSAGTARGETLLNSLDLPESSEPASRNKALTELIAVRIAFRDQMFETTSKATANLEGLARHLSACVNCYNCRVACPVCYCKECVFLTDVFDHKPWQFMSWAKQKGLLKMPTDTIFFHLTRMAHMSVSCVGCGQCSNACPNGVPVMELFRTVASITQKGFDYEPGRNIDEPLPLSIFKEKEFAEVTAEVS